MRAYILSIGTELTQGLITDTNATFLAQELVALGIELIHVTQVGDDRARLAATVRRATDEAELVICTGGVGPTEDDLTREAIADVVGEEPAVDPPLLETVKSFFASRGAEMPERNAKQAWLIPSAEALPNPVGTAPGWYVRRGERRIVAMPGVPREMFRMWREQALPRVTAELTGRIIRGMTFKTIGIGESAAEQLVGDLVARENPVVATYAKDDGVHVRVTGFGDTVEEAERIQGAAAAEVRDRLRPFIYAESDIPLADVILDRVRGSGRTLAVVEQGSGGRLGALLGGSMSAFGALEGSISLPYPPREGVPQPVAAADLAARAVEEFGAAIGLGLVVDLDPVDGVPGVYQGSVDVALAGDLAGQERHPTRASLADVHRRAAMTAVDHLRKALNASVPQPSA